MWTRRKILKTAAMATLVSGTTLASPMREAVARNSRKKDGFLTGINLAGAEFGTTFPGRHGKDYLYPSAIDVATYQALGFNVIRLPFRWERLQPDLGAPFDPVEWSRLNALSTKAFTMGFKVILDPHNYAHRRIRDDGFANEHVIGSPKVPIGAFSEFWAELTRRTKDEPNFIYGLMNEPANIEPQVWFKAAQQAITAIRAENASQLILVPGAAYSTAQTWHDAGNEIMAGITDPKENFAIEVHQYLDADSTGRSAIAVSDTIGTERISAFEAWSRKNKLRAFLGEFGVSSNLVNLSATRQMLNHIADNQDVWMGWTAWAGGPWWPDEFPFRLDPDASGTPPPQTRLLMEFIPGR